MLRTAARPQIAPTDAELLRRYLQSRDDEAFGRLVARHSQAVRRVAVRTTGNATAADDVAQAAFIVLSRRPRAAWISASCRGSALPWLVRTTRYAASTWRRTETRRRRHESAAVVSARVDPSEMGALGEAVAAVLSRMPTNERRLITLRHLDEKPWAQIAQELGTSPEAARKSAARAMSRLRERLAQQGVVVTPAALAIALSSLAGSAGASTAISATTSAFVIARGVLTMMKIKTAGVAGTAIVAGVMSVGMLGTGLGGGSATSAAPTAAQGAGLSTEMELTLSTGASEAGKEAGVTQQDEAQDRPASFRANEHQPSVKLADGSTLTLVALTNREDGWWHADGAKAQNPRRQLPMGNSTSSISFQGDDAVIEMAFFRENVPAANEEAAGDDANTDAAADLLGVLTEGRELPGACAIAVNAEDDYQALRVMIPVDEDAESHEAYLCFASGARRKIGQIENVDGAWRANEDAQEWIKLSRDGEKIVLELREGTGDADGSWAISASAAGGDVIWRSGYPEGDRIVFEPHMLVGAERIDIFRRKLQVVRMSDLAARPQQETRGRMENDDEPMLLMSSHDGAGAQVRSHVTVGHGHGGGGAGQENIPGIYEQGRVKAGAGHGGAAASGGRGHGGTAQESKSKPGDQ